MMNPLPKYALSVRGFCEAFSLGRSTFYNLVNSGQIKTAKVGAKTLIPIDECERFSESLNQQSAA